VRILLNSRFVDRDMFMRLRGGGIGHKATWEWNELLLSDVGKAVDDEPEESDDSESEEMKRSSSKESGGIELDHEPASQAEDAENDVWEDMDLGGELGRDENEDPETLILVMQGPENDGGSESDESNESDDGEEQDPDRVVPDEGEELDDDIYANEGYGTL
jgi:hypothetical protein